MEALPSFNGPGDPPSCLHKSHGPLSDVKITNVFLSNPSDFNVCKICPTLQSSSSTVSPYLPLADLP